MLSPMMARLGVHVCSLSASCLANEGDIAITPWGRLLRSCEVMYMVGCVDGGSACSARSGSLWRSEHAQAGETCERVCNVDHEKS